MSNFFLSVILAGLLLFAVSGIGMTQRDDGPAYTATIGSARR